MQKKYKSAVADSELFIRIGPLTEVKGGGYSSHASVSPSESYALPFWNAFAMRIKFCLMQF